MSSLQHLRVKIFADGADKAGIVSLNKNPLIQGMTTNPTLMHKVGIRDYEAFARDILETVTEKPISFEVFSEDFPEMKRQALKIASWAENVYVKIPVTNIHGESAAALIRELSADGVKLNVTAILTLDQVRAVIASLHPDVPSVVSVFAGRIADTGMDPLPTMQESKKLLIAQQPRAELLWGSVREVLNIFQADACGCDVVTVTHEILERAQKLCGMDLTQLSLDTVRMFDVDAKKAGFSL